MATARRATLRDFTLFLVAATLLVGGLQYRFYTMSQPTLDALRYADYALNIQEHGVFGLSGTQRAAPPAPGNANSPLYPALIALVSAADTGLARSLACALTTPEGPCPHDYGSLILVQDALAVGALAFIWLTALALFRRRTIAWLTALFVLASTKLLFFANEMLTEILVLFFFAACLWALAVAVRTGRRRWWLLVGAILGALTLTRPEYIYLAYSLAGLGAILVVQRGVRRYGPALAGACCAFLLLVGPWVGRNYLHFGELALTGGYSDVIFAYRSAYNYLTPPEWAAAFVYWLPGYGETLAARFLPPDTWARLGTDADDLLYTESRRLFDTGLAAVDGDRDRLMAYLLRTEVLEHPLRHAIAAIPLAWRGILAGKYLAVIGLPALLALAWFALSYRSRAIPVLLLPACVMIALYATVSVSIPRYNVYLIYYYALAVAWACVSLFERRRLREADKARMFQ